MARFENLSSLLEDLAGILDELFLVGLETAGSIEQARLTARRCEDLGLAHAAELVQRIADGVEQRRHSAAFDLSPLVREYCLLNEYLNLARGKLEQAKARAAMQQSIEV